MTMRWHDLLFLHWPAPREELIKSIPPGLELDLFEGQAWIGIIPFWMSNIRPRGLPALPWISRFPELNVRTYVHAGGKPGVWFFSLDAANPVAVRIARRFFHLPYFDAQMHIQPGDQDQFAYSSERSHLNSASARFRAIYGPAGPVRPAAAGSLAAWLTDRYCLYAADPTNRIWRTEIDHARWPLQPAYVKLQTNTMTAPLGLSLTRPAPLAHYSRFLEVLVWSPERVHPPEMAGAII